MKHSPISLSDLESLRDDYRAILSRTENEVTQHRDTSDPEQFRKAVDSGTKILQLLRKLSLGDTEREKYVDGVLRDNASISGLKDPTSVLGFTGFTTIIMGYNVKPIRDLTESYWSTLKTKSIEERKGSDAQIGIRELQQYLLREGRRYIATHQQEKLTGIKRFRRTHPLVTGPTVVYASGKYRTGPVVNFFGEILSPNLLMLGMGEEARETLKRELTSLPIKDGYKSRIIEQIKSKSSDDIHHGHRLNFDIIVRDVDLINGTLSLYHDRATRRASCLPIYELEGVLPAIFDYETLRVSPFLTGDRRALDLLNGYVNAFLTSHNVKPLAYFIPKKSG